MADLIVGTHRARPSPHRETSPNDGSRQPTTDHLIHDRTGGAGLDLTIARAAERRLAEVEAQISAIRHLLAPSAGSVGPEVIHPVDGSIRVSCLGPFEVRVGGAPFEEWRSGKARGLFQFLVTHCGQSISRDTLIHALWPDSSVGAPGTSLKVAVHSLRQAFQRFGATAPLPKIFCQGSCYRLVAPQLWLDVDEFEHCYTIGRGHEQEEREGAAIGAYVRAAELYRGDFLDEATDDWPAFRREHLKDQYLYVLTRLATMAQRNSDFQGAIGWCHRLLAKDRCREDAYRTLMICHAHLGQRSRVRRWYELCIQTLRDELDCQPEPETERVFRRATEGKH